MSARTNLVLKDRAGTPVSHTFTPDGDDQNNVHAYSEKTGVPAGYSRFTASLDTKGKNIRARLKLSVPITANQVINGITTPTVVRTSYAEVSFTFDPLSSVQERSDVVGMTLDSLLASQTQINDLLVNVSDIY